ncbi:pirin family protein [Flavobacterium phycosphaerae]|uniref:pirin family protein n=1 Tax=Flavobacterium phycosphaerae TaxID=2697515 RepID=UPI00138A61DE|nr:hypothetical protein [Flavobacterium phycosphaerae]
MLSQSPAQIYKAQSRGHEEDETYRCLSTLNFGAYFEESRRPFGAITVFNDETLAPKKVKTFSVDYASEVLLIPLVGTIDFDNKNYINTEEMLLFSAEKDTVFQLQNPFETELINYLQIRLQSSKVIKNDVVKKHFSFSIRNELFIIHENETTKVSIGIFDSRSEGLYHLDKNTKGAFVFVIHGAFEFQNRLLESRDSLTLWEIAEIEYESLTENAILLLLETALQE